MKKRVLSALLVLCMLLTLLPAAAWAAEREEVPVGEEAQAAPVAEKAPAAAGGTYLCQVTWSDGYKRNSDVVTIPHVHAVSVGCEAEGEGQVTFTAWDKADSLPATAGSYVLTGDVALSNTWTVPQGVTNLCLGGHTIQRATGGSQSPITIPSGSALHICDCSESKTGTINGYGGTWTISVLGTLSLYGGTVTYGSIGVDVSYGGVFQMHGGSVKGIMGTGVQVRDDSTFLMDGGTITGNSTGVVVYANGAFRAEGNVVIDGNGSSGSPQNVVMYSKKEGNTTTAAVPMELFGSLGANAKLGLGLHSWSDMEKVSPYLALQGYNGYAVTADDFAKLSSDDSDNYPLKLTNGKVYFTTPQAHAHDMSVDCGSGDPITFAKALTCNQDGVLCVDGVALELSDNLLSVVLPAGNYYLAQDVTLAHRMNIQGVVNLCLNGHEINFTENNQVESIFNVKGGGTLNLCDCNGSQGSHSFTSPVTKETVTVEGGLVTGGWKGTGASFYGTAAYVWEGGAMNLYGGTIAGNGSANNSRGAIYVDERGTFQMYGGTLCHNTSAKGGGIFITGAASILGGEIAHNNATGSSISEGGGLLLGNTGSLTLGGDAVIRDNAAQAEGGGIRIYAFDGKAPTLIFTGAPTVTGNTVGGKPSNVYLDDGVVADATGMTGGSIGVTTQTAPTAGSPVNITTANSADLSGYFVSDKDDQVIENGENNVVQLAVKSTHVHAMSAGCETEGEGLVAFTSWTDPGNLPTTAGNYCLAVDVVLSERWSVPGGTTNLCLNGHTISITGTGYTNMDSPIYFRDASAVLNLCDCSEEQTGGVNAGERDTAIDVDGTLRLYGGTVKGNLFGVIVGGAFEMHGGSVTDTTDSRHQNNEIYGAAVLVESGDTFRMTGGAISGNMRGVQVEHGGTFLVEGNVIIADNEAANVWLEGKASDPTVVYLTGALGEAAKLSLSAEDWSLVEEHSSLAAVRGQDYPITEADFAKLSSYDPDYPLRLADGVVSFIVGPRHTHAVSVGCEAEGEGQVTFTRLSAKDGALYIGTQKLEPNLDGQYPLPGGNYYLTEDIELGYPIVVPSNRFGGSVSLCLNGHQLKYAGDGQHSVIYTTWDLNICDCNGSDGHHTVTDPTANESVDIAGGLITGGTNGGVFVESISESAFNLYGGSIAGNKGPRGSGVNLGNCVSMHLYGGQVSYNTWEQDPDGGISGFGGIYLYATSGYTSEVQLAGDSKVAHNVGGGIRARYGSVTLSGSAAVADNQGIGNWPSGICLDQNSTLAMSGSASVTGNHIATDFYLSAPTCGGVYAPSGGVTLSGGAKIWDNKINQPGGMTVAADLVLGSESDTEGNDTLVTIGGPLTADAKIGVSLLTPGQRVFTTGGGGDYADRFTSQQRGRFVEAREGELSLTPYAILQQPTQANQCTVTVNGAPTSYKWYPAKLAEVTGANATAYTTEQGESSSCDGQGVWTGVKDLYDHYFFTIQLSRGDMLVVKPSQDLGYMASVQIVSQDQDHVATGSSAPGQDGAYRLTVPRDGTYDLSLSSQVESLTLTATRLALGAEVEGQTTKQFTGESGSYLCRIRYADGTTLTSDIMTCSGSSVTPGKTDQAAPAGLFTVTDIPAGAATGSIAVTKDADKLEWRPVTTPATGVWTPVVQSGNTATLTGLAAGSYEFRYKETATHNASPTTTVQVRALSPDAKALTIAGDIEHGTVTKRRDTVNPGDTVTLAVQPDAGYQLETITVRYTEGGVDKTITPTAKADNPAQYTFTMPDAAVSVTATFVPIPDQGDVKGEVEVKGDTPAVTVDQDTLKDLAGEVPEGESVTVKLTVEKLDAPTDKADIEAVVTGDKANVLYLDLSLVKRVNDNAPTPITDTGDKVLEIVVPYDLTGKTGVSVYRKHGGSAAERLTRADTKADGTYRLEGAGTQGKVYIYTSKFSTYAIGYTAVENLVSTQAPALYLGSTTPIPCDGSTVSLPGGGTALFRELSETPNGGKVYGLTLENANITDVVRIQLGRVGSELVYGAGALFLADQKDTLVVTLKGENTIAVTGTDIDDRIAALAVPGSPVMLVGDGFLTAKATAAAGKEAYGVNVTDLTLNTAVDITAPDGAVYVAGGLTLGGGYAVTRPASYTLSPSGSYGKALMEGGAPAGRVTVEKKATTSPSRPSSGRPGTVRPSQSAWPFTDVAATDAFYESVKYVYEKGWMLGTSDTAFSPEGELTRAMLAAILYRAAGSPAVKGGPGFEDTLADTWYSDAIVWAAQTQVLRGYGNGKFGPNDPVSEEMMNMVTARQAGQDPAWVGDPALAAPATRAQAAAMLERYIQVEK